MIGKKKIARLDALVVVVHAYSMPGLSPSFTVTHGHGCRIAGHWILIQQIVA